MFAVARVTLYIEWSKGTAAFLIVIEYLLSIALDSFVL